MEYIHHFVTVFGMTLSAILGFVVYFSNSHRNANRSYAVLSTILTIWLLCREIALLYFDGLVPAMLGSLPFSHLKFWMLLTIAFGMLIPPGMVLLKTSYEHFDVSWRHVYRKNLAFICIALVMFSLTISGVFLTDIVVSGNYPKPSITTLGKICFLTYYLGSIILIAITFRRCLKKATGLQFFELQFVLLGSVSGLLFGCTTGFILPALPFAAIQAFPYSALTPLAAIILNSFVAYGIVTRKIMDVKWVIRNLFAYGIVLGCTCGIYLLVFFATTRLAEPGASWPSMIASAVAVLSMMPLVSTTSRLTNRLFINWTVVDYNNLLSQAEEFMTTINTTEDLLHQFATFTEERFASEHVQIFVKNNKNTFEQSFPVLQPENRVVLEDDSPVIGALTTIPNPIDQQLLERSRPAPTIQALKQELMNHNAQIAIGNKSTEGLSSIMFVGPKETRRIYTSKEKETLQLLFNRLTTALRNAALYTEAENSRIYNDILLYSLVNGVIAIGTDRSITVCNKEAQRILGLTEDSSPVGQPYTILPPDIAHILDETLIHSAQVRDTQYTLKDPSDPEGEREYNLRLSSSNFRSQDGENLGALLILNDVTEMKKLEEQIHQNDRLASIGTLSAGMAHEIKNPLVSIKTFAQLLPERYQDEEFRNTFSGIMEGEISRIDTIVNQLLSFARPSKPCLVPMPLHFVIERTLTLVTPQLKNNQVGCENYFTSEDDTIMGDANQLEQVFLNLILNANDSMPDGGKLTIKTHRFEVDNQWNSEEERLSKIRVMIMDTGMGIPKEKQGHIFDPFFTTKSTGTGLGLSVSHSILEEHACEISVESEVEKGTVFHLTFDLITQEAPV